ncbi:hypothetical protein FRB95_005673 [Tulasnella sp. JGI-2019a]|nr:hypothetical protein FRB95_005673 [Tulasnella sp. JGI-2019a]
MGGVGKTGASSSRMAESSKPLPMAPVATRKPHRSNTTASAGPRASTSLNRSQTVKVPVINANPAAGIGATTINRSQSIKKPVQANTAGTTNFSRPQPGRSGLAAAGDPSRPPVAAVKRSNTTPLTRTVPAISAQKTTIRLPPATQPRAGTSGSAQKPPAPPPKGPLGRSKSESQKPGSAGFYKNKNEAINALKAPLPVIPQGAVAKNLVLVAEPNATVLDSGLPNITSNHVVRVAESGGLCMQEAQRALYGRHIPASQRINWHRTAEDDQNVKGLLEWIERTRWGLASLGLHKFLATKSRGALVFNVHGRLKSDPDTPAVDWMTWEDARRTLDGQLQNYMSTYDPAAHVLIFVMRVSPTGDSLKIWGKKIGVPASLPVTYEKEIKAIKKKLDKKKSPILSSDLQDEKPVTRSNSIARWFKRKLSL